MISKERLLTLEGKIKLHDSNKKKKTKLSTAANIIKNEAFNCKE